MKYQIPNTSFEVEVFETEQQVGLIIRDLSLATPPFDPVTFLEDSSHNVIHQEWMAKWLDPQSIEE